MRELQEMGLKPLYEVDKISYSVEHVYIPDFTIKKNRKKIYIEAKGYFDVAALVKMKNVKRCNPKLDIRIVFYDPTKKVRKNSKMTYADWADKYGFPWSARKAPKSWFQ